MTRESSSLSIEQLVCELFVKLDFFVSTTVFERVQELERTVEDLAHKVKYLSQEIQAIKAEPSNWSNNGISREDYSDTGPD